MLPRAYNPVRRDVDCSTKTPAKELVAAGKRGRGGKAGELVARADDCHQARTHAFACLQVILTQSWLHYWRDWQLRMTVFALFTILVCGQLCCILSKVTSCAHRCFAKEGPHGRRRERPAG